MRASSSLIALRFQTDAFDVKRQRKRVGKKEKNSRGKGCTRKECKKFNGESANAMQINFSPGKSSRAISDSIEPESAACLNQSPRNAQRSTVTLDASGID